MGQGRGQGDRWRSCARCLFKLGSRAARLVSARWARAHRVLITARSSCRAGASGSRGSTGHLRAFSWTRKSPASFSSIFSTIWHAALSESRALSVALCTKDALSAQCDRSGLFSWLRALLITMGLGVFSDCSRAYSANSTQISLCWYKKHPCKRTGKAGQWHCGSEKGSCCFAFRFAYAQVSFKRKYGKKKKKKSYNLNRGTIHLIQNVQYTLSHLLL